jgi:hypothetical protein
MTLPISVADRLGKLIPRLATDHDGEIVNTVRAIRRTLEGAGQDLHDLAARLTGKGPRPEARTYGPPPAAGPWRWRGLSAGERVIALDGIKGITLSPWEREFVRNIDARLRQRPSASLSPRQIEILDGLLRRAWEEEQ